MRNIFLEKSCNKCARKTITCNKFFLKIWCFDRKLSKIFQRLTSFSFWTQSLLMNKIIRNKRDLELVTNHYSDYETSHKNFFISYILSDQVWSCNIKRFLSYSKITPEYLCKPNHNIINYSTSICPFESGKCGIKKKENYKNLNISKTKRAI